MWAVKRWARLLQKAKTCQHLNIVNVNSTYYGGGVAELLSSLTLLMNQAGIKTGWRVIQGAPDFFSITKKMHNALQGGKIDLTEREKQIYEDVIHENAVRNHFDNHNFVIIHDPQPLPMITHYHKHCPWIWRCHVDLSRPNRKLWRYLSGYIEKYDAVILSLEEYRQRLKTPQRFFFPGIDPFNMKNREMSETDIDARLEYYGIPTDLPLVVQVSRFDTWKDPKGAIKAFKAARRQVDCTLVMLGNVATDDPEGAQVYESLLDERSERIHILSHQDSFLVNALQRRAAVVLQKSRREGFGLTVTEAMWKGAAVVGGKVGGICHQIEDGVSGFLVSSVQEAADRIVQLLKDPDLRQRLGKKAKETVTQRFLLTYLLEKYLDLFTSFETIYRFNLRKK